MGTDPRPVRSFVRREGRFTTAQRAAIERLWNGRGLEIGEHPLDPATLFPGAGRIVLEIGFGMGQTLVELAQQAPATGFIGIEVHRPGVGALLAAAERRELQNIRVFCADALQVLAHAIPDGALDAVLLFFPDPWPKKRHHKRRIVQPAFVALVQRKLRPGGLFHLATDWEEYAVHMRDVLEAAPGWRNLAGSARFAARPETRPVTKFEARGRLLGHGVWDLLYVRIGAALAPD